MTETTAVATRPAPPPLAAGGTVAAIIPRTVEEMFRVAQAIAGSGLAPRTMDTKEKVLVAIMAGAELGLAPHQACQSFYVVNQRPTLWGDAIPALLWANGFKLREWYEDGGPEGLTAKCEITRPGGDVIPGEFSMEDAKKANLLNKDGPWKTATKRMLKMRARAFAARDGAADVLRGFQIREEVEDYQTLPARDVAPPKSGIMQRLERHGAPGNDGFSHQRVEEGIATHQPKPPEELDAVLEGDNLPAHDPVTGEVVDAEFSDAPPADDLPVRDDGPGDDAFPGDTNSTTTRAASGENPGAGGGLTLAQRVAEFDKRIADAKTTIKLRSIWEANGRLREDLDRSDPEELATLEQRFNDRYADVETAEKAARQ